MSTFSIPDLKAPEITETLAQAGIANLRPEDLSNLTFDVVFSIYANFLSYADPLGDDPDGQVGFDALEILENPEHHSDAIRITDVYRKVKDLLAAIGCTNFTLRDMLRPDPRRTLHILRAIVNFLFYREEKINLLQPIVGHYPVYEERRIELESKIAELNNEIEECELARKAEEPMVEELDKEVKQLKNSLHSYNKQQASLKMEAKGLKEKIDSITRKITQADLELVNNAQENSKLRSKVVQSPDKLQRTLEEKKAIRTEVKNSEKLAVQTVQKKTATLEVYSKAYNKMSKLLSQAQAIQEQVNSAKGVEKEVKSYKSKLSEEAVTSISLDAKIDEFEGKVKQVEELVKAMEKERETRHEQENQQLDHLRTELEGKLQNLEPREKAVEAMVAKGHSLRAEAEATKEAAKVEQQQILAKHEAIAKAYFSYSNRIDSAFQSFLTNADGESPPL